MGESQKGPGTKQELTAHAWCPGLCVAREFPQRFLGVSPPSGLLWTRAHITAYCPCTPPARFYLLDSSDRVCVTLDQLLAGDGFRFGRAGDLG